MPEPFDEHACVSFDFVDPIIESIKAGLDSIKPGIEALLLPLESLVDVLKPPFKRPKSLIKVLNEFLIHAASVSKRLVCLPNFVKETQSFEKGITAGIR